MRTITFHDSEIVLLKTVVGADLSRNCGMPSEDRKTLKRIYEMLGYK